MPVKGISIAARKQKARLLQQWVRDKILSVFPSLTSHDVRSTSMGSSGMDVQLSTEARALFAYSVECKSLKTGLSLLYNAMDQATISANKEKLTPLVVVKQNGKGPLVILRADDFFTKGL